MAHRGYDVVVDVDTEGDLARTDLQDDLEFHSSDFSQPHKLGAGPDSTPFLSSGSNPSSLPTSSNINSNKPGQKHMLWTLSFYRPYFDVDTSTVLHRCRHALLPFPPFSSQPFLDTLNSDSSTPDLYGPFWIATTVVVILFLTGTISHKLATSGQQHFEYDFRLLSGAAGLIYGYTAFVPLALWALLRWFNAQGVDLVECFALYGYANLFWIVVALVSWSPLDGLNYAVVGVGFGVSGWFLVRNLWPVIRGAEGSVGAGRASVSRVLLLVVVAVHAGLAVAIKILFFSHGSPARKNTGGSTGGSGTTTGPSGALKTGGGSMMY